MRDSITPEQAPGSDPRSPQGASTPAGGAREGRGAYAASEGPSEASGETGAAEREDDGCALPGFMGCDCNHIDGCRHPAPAPVVAEGVVCDCGHPIRHLESECGGEAEPFTAARTPAQQAALDPPTPVAHATPCGPNVCGVVTHEGAGAAEPECDHDSQVIEHEGVAYWACLKCGHNHGPVDTPAPEPGLREQVAEAVRRVMEQDLTYRAQCNAIADAVLAVRDTKLEQLRERLARVAALADEYPVHVDTALLLEALDGQAVNPPGSTQEQLPADVLALLPRRSYLSTACEVARLLEGAAIANPERAAELREWRDRMQQRCRLNNKYTGALCTGSYHKEQP